jgi:hypothetical protein
MARRPDELDNPNEGRRAPIATTTTSARGTTGRSDAISGSPIHHVTGTRQETGTAMAVWRDG